MSTPTRARLEPGIYRDADGAIIVRPRLGSKHTIELAAKTIRFPAGTDVGIARAALLKELGKLQAEINAWKTAKRPDRGTLAADVVEYFETATLSPKTRAWRETAIFPWWIARFPNRSRHTLEAGEIIRALNTLEATIGGWNKTTADGTPAARRFRPASASTKNHYRTALAHLFMTLNGKNGSNPVKDVPKYDEGTAAARDLDYDVIDAILAQIRPGSASWARLTILAYAPLTPKQLASVPRRDVDLVAGTILVPGRAKGAGTAAIAKPLLPQALAAFRVFDTLALWERTCSRASLRRVFIRARAAALETLRQTRPDLDVAAILRSRPYDLRHSFGTAVSRSGVEREDVQALLHHADARTTDRYIRGAVSQRLQAAGERIAAAFAARPAYVPPAPAPASRPRLVKR